MPEDPQVSMSISLLETRLLVSGHCIQFSTTRTCSTGYVHHLWYLGVIDNGADRSPSNALVISELINIQAPIADWQKGVLEYIHNIYIPFGA